MYKMDFNIKKQDTLNKIFLNRLTTDEFYNRSCLGTNLHILILANYN